MAVSPLSPGQRLGISVREEAHFLLQISNSIEADEVIDCDEFQLALGIANPELGRRIFTVFDTNGDGNISFVVSSPAQRGAPLEELAFSHTFEGVSPWYVALITQRQHRRQVKV